MIITVVGLNHKTAPVHLREKIALNSDQVHNALTKLKEKYPDGEFMILSTCNRVETYFSAPKDGDLKTDNIIDFLAAFCDIDKTEFDDHLYIHNSDEAVRHLLRVSCSLDSLVLGEPQILAQVKEAYRLSNRADCAGKIVHRLLHCAFATSKEVYTMTSIAQRRVSVASVAVDLARQLFEDLTKARVAVIGAGEMGEQLIRHLLDSNSKDITVFNRTLKRAEMIAKRHNIKSSDWNNLTDAMKKVDIVIAAAMAEDHLFDKTMLKGRKTGSLLIIDIAVPRNFDPAVNDLDGVYLYSVDDLAEVTRDNIAARQDDIGQANEIIDDNVTSFMDWFGLKDIGPMIGQLRKSFHKLSMAELDQFIAGEVDANPLLKQKMEAAVNRIVNKLLHRLINNFHTIARDQGSDKAVELIEKIIQYEDRSVCPAKLARKLDEGLKKLNDDND